MKHSEIKVGGLYLASVGGKVRTVRVDRIKEDKGKFIKNKGMPRYDVTVLDTGHKVEFRSAAKFRGPAQPHITGLDTGPLGGLTTEASEEADPTLVPIHACTVTDQETNTLTGVHSEDEYSSDPTLDLATTADRKVGASSESSVDSSVPASSVPDQTVGTSSLASEIATARQGRKVGDRIAGWIPSPEQEAILAAASKMELEQRCGRVMVIAAGAGCAKTSTDLMLEQVLTGKGQYTAFNTKLVAESKGKFKKAHVNTTHSLAFRAVGHAYQHRLNSERIKSGRIAQMLGISDFTIILKGKGPPITRTGEDGNVTKAYSDYASLYGFDKYVPPRCDYEDGTGRWTDDGGPLYEEYNKYPDSEDVRAIYADWLEENVSEHHANFVRDPHDDLVKNLPSNFLAGQVMEAIKRFCQSADREVNESHIYSPALRSLGEEGMWKFKRHLLPFVQKAWADLTKLDGVLPFVHDHYVKIWQLGTGQNRPIIPADYILLDEGQDTAPVFLDVLAQQQHALLVIVGDDNQQIYEWRGAVNALSFFKDAPRLLLSQSYRYGQTIADVANAVLSTLEEPTDLVLKGNPEIPSRVITNPQETLTNARCYLYRTNAGAVGRVMEAYLNGQRPHLVGKCDDVISWCQAALDLQQGKKTIHYDLGCFDTWAEVEEYSKTDEGADLRLMVKMVKQFGADNIIQALKKMPKEEDADLVVSTAHKSKGLEWDSVKLGHDFPLANKMMDSDRRLLYVALTRAKLTLDVSDCPPFCGGNEWEDSATSMSNPWVPGLTIKHTVPMPTHEQQMNWSRLKQSAAAQIGVPQKQVVNVVEIKSATNGKFTWTKYNEKWCVRGPINIVVGTKVEVEKRDGSKQLLTIKSVVKKYDDAWIYSV